MASPVPTEMSDNVLSAAKRGNRLARTSVVFAAAALVAATLGFALAVFASALPPQIAPLSNGTVVVLYIGGLIAGIVAIVTGVLALVRPKRYPPQQQRRGWAIAGLVMGIVVTVPLVFPGGFFFLLFFSCAFNHMCV